MNGKTQSILSYLGILWLVAYFAGKSERDSLSRFHLKQGLGLFVVNIILGVIVFGVSMASPSVGGIISLGVTIIFFILMVIGIINAINSAEKPLPLIGKNFVNKFEFIDKN